MQGEILMIVSHRGQAVLRAVAFLMLACILVGGLVALPVQKVQAASLTVNTTDDVNDGVCDATHCSLREAILAANVNSDVDTIGFNIPGLGPFSIAPASPLPQITNPVIIDGTT